jgi:hypothetical protein
MSPTIFDEPFYFCIRGTPLIKEQFFKDLSNNVYLSNALMRVKFEESRQESLYKIKKCLINFINHNVVLLKAQIRRRISVSVPVQV